MKQTILIVDDEPANIRIIQSALDGEYTLLAATSGETAIEVARQSMPDMILMDVLMPGLDGIETAKRILDLAGADPEPAIIFVTSLDDAEKELSALTSGGTDYLTKPVHPRVLQTRVRLHMTNRVYVQYLRAVIDQRTKSLEEAREEARSVLTRTLGAGRG